MRYLTFFVFFALVVENSTAQSSCFTYDLAGNRISRAQCVVLLQSSDSLVVTPLIALAEGVVLLYPNPNLGIFQVRTDEYPPEADVDIFDANARRVEQRKFGDGFFDISTQPPGLYLLRLSYDGIRPRTIKLEIVKD
jgi:Secretion system C-terminal sorting domain